MCACVCVCACVCACVCVCVRVCVCVQVVSTVLLNIIPEGQQPLNLCSRAKINPQEWGCGKGRGLTPKDTIMTESEVYTHTDMSCSLRQCVCDVSGCLQRGPAVVWGAGQGSVWGLSVWLCALMPRAVWRGCG